MFLFVQVRKMFMKNKFDFVYTFLSRSKMCPICLIAVLVPGPSPIIKKAEVNMFDLDIKVIVILVLTIFKKI